MEGLIVRGWDPILPGCRWLHELQIFSDQLMGRGFHTVRGGIDPRDRHFSPGWR